MMRRSFAPGRVNLIGEHTDYTGGFVVPMAVHLGSTVALEVGGDEVRLTSADEDDEAVVPLDVTDPSALRPAWARYVGGVVAEVAPAAGGRGTVTTTLPIGAGLSSSAALEVAV
jgi:galactokinase